MVAVALEVGQNPAITIATLNIVLTVLECSIIAGMVYVAIKGHLPLKGGNATKGVVFGALLMLLLFVFSPGGFDGDLPLAPLLGSGLFMVLCLVFGVAMVKVVAWLEHSLPAPKLRPVSIVGYASLMFLGCLSVLIFLVTDVAPLVNTPLRLVGIS
jgi:hypothetical protein